MLIADGFYRYVLVNPSALVRQNTANGRKIRRERAELAQLPQCAGVTPGWH